MQNQTRIFTYVCVDFLYNIRPLSCWPVFYTLHSFDYENAGYQTAELIKMDILLNGKPVEELATVVHR